MIGANKKKSDFATPYTVSNALTKGGAAVKLSALIMGLGNIAHKQIIKGLIFLAIEIGYIMFMVNAGAYYLSMLPSLGWRKQEEVFNEQKQIYEYVQGDNSVLLLLYGVATIAITLLFIYMWAENLRSAYMAECLAKEGKEINSFGKDVKSLFDKNLYKTLMFLPLMGILIFTVLPLLFMIPMAFTNYSTINKHLTLFDWVGLANFKTVLGLGGKIGKTFWRVLGWTIVWAVFATFLCNFLGLILAIVINRKETHCKAFWRTCFVISIAVPQFVSLLVMRQMLQEHGAVNNLLMEWGLIQNPLPFWTNTMWARVSVILINCWVGIPYTMLQVTGVLQNVMDKDSLDVETLQGFTLNTHSGTGIQYLVKDGEEGRGGKVLLQNEADRKRYEELAEMYFDKYPNLIESREEGFIWADLEIRGMAKRTDQGIISIGADGMSYSDNENYKNNWSVRFSGSMYEKLYEWLQNNKDSMEEIHKFSTWQKVFDEIGGTYERVWSKEELDQGYLNN